MSDIEMADATSQSDSPAFNPDQDPEERRAVRKQYRTLQRKAQETAADLRSTTADALIKQVKDADELFKQVKGPQEATLDSAFLLSTANQAAQKARALKSGSGTFDIDEFVSKLLSFMGGEHIDDAFEEDDDTTFEPDYELLDWGRIGRKALAKSRRVAVAGFMLGPLSVEQKVRVVARREKLEKNKEDLKRPQELREEDISRSENETTKNVRVLNTVLEQAGETNLFRFIVNPNDFAQSVENLFYLSFLIRDGKVAFDIQDGEPMVFVVDDTDAGTAAQDVQKLQMVMELDMATWKKAIEVFNITEPLIPQRPPAKTRLGDKWYG